MKRVQSSHAKLCKRIFLQIIKETTETTEGSGGWVNQTNITQECWEKVTRWKKSRLLSYVVEGERMIHKDG